MTDIEHIKSLSFLQASKIVSTSDMDNHEEHSVVIAGSAQLEPLELYLKAVALKLGYNLNCSFIPFNTLQQYILSTQDNKSHIFLIFPWDLYPSLDWRTGVKITTHTLKEVIDEARYTIKKFNRIALKSVVYVDADIPPVLLSRQKRNSLRYQLNHLIGDAGAKVISGDYFSLSNYLASGFPLSNDSLSNIAYNCLDSMLSAGPKKVLVTDFDNVMWQGVIGEDGLKGINCSNQGEGYLHYLYQSYLKSLMNSGVLLLGVTRNDADLASLPFKEGMTLLSEEDFIYIVASYNAKSSQIKKLSDTLNLPLDSFVFVDDNPIEIEEVNSSCKNITCIRFPKDSRGAVAFFDDLSSFFDFNALSDEDINRTALYKTRAKAILPSTNTGSDLTDFLSRLKMKVIVKKCTPANSNRAIQLINKTNQFNSNGIRVDTESVNLSLSNGSVLYTFGLTDIYGEHGDVAVLLLDENNVVQNFVMSCRVFQRRLEYFVLLWAHTNLALDVMKVHFRSTAKNAPFREFIDNSGSIVSDSEYVVMDLKAFAQNNASFLRLFEIVNK